MKQTDLEVSDLKRKIKLRFNEIQQSGKPNKSVRNLKSEHVREKTLAKGFRWHDQNTDQIGFQNKIEFDSSLLLPVQVLEIFLPLQVPQNPSREITKTNFVCSPPVRHFLLVFGVWVWLLLCRVFVSCFASDLESRILRA